MSVPPAVAGASLGRGHLIHTGL